MQVFLSTPFFSSFRYIPRSGIACSYGYSVLNFLKETWSFAFASLLPFRDECVLSPYPQDMDRGKRERREGRKENQKGKRHDQWHFARMARP